MKTSFEIGTGGEPKAIFTFNSKEIDVLFDALYMYEIQLGEDSPKAKKVRAILDEVYHMSNLMFDLNNRDTSDE